MTFLLAAVRGLHREAILSTFQSIREILEVLQGLIREALQVLQKSLKRVSGTLPMSPFFFVLQVSAGTSRK